MFEIIMDMLNPPSWYALYISILLGIGATVALTLVTAQPFLYSLVHCSNLQISQVRLEISRLNIYTLHDWIAKIIRRKDCPRDDVGDHCLLGL